MRRVLTGLITMLFITCGHAQEYYKWVDADGVTHYGEVLPDPGIEYEALELPRQYASSEPDEDYYSIQNQLKRLQEQRLLWHKLNVPERPQQDVIVREVVYQPEERYVPAYPYYYKRHHNKGRYHHKKHSRHYGYGKKHNGQPVRKPYNSNKQLKLPKRNPALIVKTN